MAIIETMGLGKEFGGRWICSDVTLSIEPGEKVALVGRNGCGKTTLIRMLVGEDNDHSGVKRRQPGARVASVSQQPPAYRGLETAAEFVCRDAIDHRHELERLAAEMEHADEQAGRQLLRRYGDVREAYDAEEGDMAEESAARLLDRAGLGHRADVPAASLSGGEKNVLSLVRAVRRMPDLLVLDEPGNHLDMAGLAWLESFLASLPCAVLLVSHDRRMLDRVVTSVLELEDGHLTRFSGNYSAYRLERLRQAAGQGQDWQADRKRVERLEALVRRFAEIARSRPDPAWGKRLRARRSQLERVKAEATERPDLGNRDAQVTFLGEASKADLALRVAGYTKSYGELAIIESSGFTVMNGERVALVGANGSGKTSLVRDIVEQGSWDNPVLRVGPSMVVGYCAQAHEVFDSQRTVEAEFLKIVPTRREAFAHLSRFLFTYDDLDKRIDSLSGGELNRLQLARASALKANFLILDEPTNHLDIPTREAVEDALAEFEGTVLVVSHDRYFMEKVAQRVVFIDDRRFVEYEGDFDEYWRDVGSRAIAHRTTGARTIEERGRRERPKASSGDAGMEQRIERLELEKQELEKAAAAAFDARDYRRAKQIATELEGVSGRLAELWQRYVSAQTR